MGKRILKAKKRSFQKEIEVDSKLDRKDQERNLGNKWASKENSRCQDHLHWFKSGKEEGKEPKTTY